MARRTVIDCDVCKKESQQIVTITLEVDSGIDGAGDRDYTTESIDLCPKCAGMRLNGLLDNRALNRSHEQNKAAIKYLKTGATSDLLKALGETK